MLSQSFAFTVVIVISKYLMIVQLEQQLQLEFQLLIGTGVIF